MKSEHKAEAELTFDFEIREDENVIAFCPSCKVVVFKGSDTTHVKRRVLRERLVDHLKYYNWEHGIDIIYPRREIDNVLDAEYYLDNGAFMTALAGLKQ